MKNEYLDNETTAEYCNRIFKEYNNRRLGDVEYLSKKGIYPSWFYVQLKKINSHFTMYWGIYLHLLILVSYILTRVFIRK